MYTPCTRCGSYALNDARETGLCDKCWRDARIAELESERDEWLARAERAEVAIKAHCHNECLGGDHGRCDTWNCALKVLKHDPR